MKEKYDRLLNGGVESYDAMEQNLKIANMGCLMAWRDQPIDRIRLIQPTCLHGLRDQSSSYPRNPLRQPRPSSPTYEATPTAKGLLSIREVVPSLHGDSTILYPLSSKGA